MFRNPLTLKLLLIVAVVVLAALASYPPEDKINLGLDLQGGAHILFQVDTNSALHYELDAAQDRIGNAMTDRGLTYASVVTSGDTGLELKGTEPAKASEVRQVLDDFVGSWDISPRGTGDYRITMPPQLQNKLTVDAVNTTLSTIRRRIDGLGVSEPQVQKQGLSGDRILVQLPGVEDPSRVKRLIRGSEELEWKELTYPPSAGSNPCNSGWSGASSREDLVAQFGGTIPDDTELIAERLTDISGTTQERWWPLKKVSVVRGTDLKDARPGTDEWNQAQINFTLSQEAGRRFEVATRNNIGCIMAIVMGSSDSKYVLSAPQIQGAIRDQGRIMGSYDLQSAEDFALQLRSGAVPAKLDIIEERTVGPSLGRDSIRSGLTAGITGFLGVMVFLVIYYRVAGINAVVALAMNVLLVFGILGALPILFDGVRATLTLPGIAGLILTVGMAVDSNVLIFERIREELRRGKTVRSAVEQGFGRAFMTILDCNVTTLVAAFFLFSYGTGPIKGFAVTLTIGLLASLFTAVFVSRQLFEIVLTLKGRSPDSLSITGMTFLKNPRFDFARHGTTLLGLSSIVVLVFLGIVLFQGINRGIEFTGGTELQIKYTESPDISSIRSALTAQDLGNVSVTSIGDPSENEIYIRIGSGEGEAGDPTSDVIKALRPETAPYDLNVIDQAQLKSLLLQAPGVEAAAAETLAEEVLRERREKRLFTEIADLAELPGMTQEIRDLLDREASIGPMSVRSQSFIFPAVGKELAQKALVAIIGSLVGMLLYIWFRFQLQWGLAAVAALFHDTVLTLGLFALFDQEMTLPVVAAFLTLVGYSVNDTVVVFDRIRENMRKKAGQPIEDVINLSINQTLSRTIITSGLTLVVVVGLLVYGGKALNPFAFVLTVGVLVGTYSSIYIASPILILWKRYAGRKTGANPTAQRRAKKVRAGSVS